MARNQDRVDQLIADRANREQWTPLQFLSELRRQLAEVDVEELPPCRTDEAAGTLEKVKVMRERVAGVIFQVWDAKRKRFIIHRRRYSPFHPDDQRLDSRVDKGLVGTGNRNGRDTELEEIDLCARDEDAPEPDIDYDAMARHYCKKSADRVLAFLRECGEAGATTEEIIEGAHVYDVNSCVGELARNGLNINCRKDKERFRYTLREEAENESNPPTSH